MPIVSVILVGVLGKPPNEKCTKKSVKCASEVRILPIFNNRYFTLRVPVDTSSIHEGHSVQKQILSLSAPKENDLTVEGALFFLEYLGKNQPKQSSDVYDESKCKELELLLKGLQQIQKKVRIIPFSNRPKAITDIGRGNYFLEIGYHEGVQIVKPTGRTMSIVQREKEHQRKYAESKTATAISSPSSSPTNASCAPYPTCLNGNTNFISDTWAMKLVGIPLRIEWRWFIDATVRTINSDFTNITFITKDKQVLLN